MIPTSSKVIITCDWVSCKYNRSTRCCKVGIHLRDVCETETHECDCPNWQESLICADFELSESAKQTIPHKVVKV